MNQLKKTQAKTLLNETKKKLSQIQVEIVQIEKLQKLAAPAGWKPNIEPKPMIPRTPSITKKPPSPTFTLSFKKQNTEIEIVRSPTKTTPVEFDTRSAPQNRQIFPLKSEMNKHFIETEDVIEFVDQKESHKSKQLREKYGY
jgi:hypothetical protein